MGLGRPQQAMCAVYLCIPVLNWINMIKKYIKSIRKIAKSFQKLTRSVEEIEMMEDLQ